MVGTVADGQLIAPTARSGSGVRFAVATPADEAAIRRLLRENPMPGAISLTFEREPDYFLGANMGGGKDSVIVAFDENRLVCMGRCTTRQAWVGGQVRRVGYLAELRLDASAQGRFEVLRGGYRFFQELRAADPADLYITSIAADNERARRLLERGLPGLPRYDHLGDLTTLLVSTRTRIESALALDSATAGELAAFLSAAGSRNNLAAAWSTPVIEALASHDLRIDSFGVFRQHREIIAAAGLWDQRRFRQTVIRGYAPALACARSFLNMFGGVFGFAPMPKTGTVLSHAYLSPLAIARNHDALLVNLVAAFGRRAATQGIEFLTLALPAGDARIDLIQRRFRCHTYASRIYRVRWPGETELALDNRPILPDVAFL